MLIKDKRPLCPKCGLPARAVLGWIEAYVELDINGLPEGKARVLPGRKVKDVKHYRCALDHRWLISQE